MANENIREIITSAVSDALNRSSRQTENSSGQESSSISRGNSKRGPRVLPSSFLKKKKKGNTSIQIWDKDIVCFPQEYVVNPQDIPIPRGKKRLDLNKKGLVGKIRLTSDMDEDEVKEQICSVFADRMNNNCKFPFKVCFIVVFIMHQYVLYVYLKYYL